MLKKVKKQWTDFPLFALILALSIVLLTISTFASGVDTIETTLDQRAAMSDSDQLNESMGTAGTANVITQHGSKLSFCVIAKDENGDKIDSAVTLNSESVENIWNDANQTSYTLTFSEEGENIVEVTAGSATKTYTVNYEPACVDSSIGQAIVSVEAFTVGGGYLVEPVYVDLYEGENAAQVLTRVLTDHHYNYVNPYENSGSSWFYLASIQGDIPELDGIPANLRQEVTNDFNVDDSYTPGSLGEFDFSNGSGWMYCVNNVFPNYGFDACYLNDGDVMRVQFTVAYGADIGGSDSVCGYSPINSRFMNDYYETMNKDDLTRLIADAGLENVSQDVLDRVYYVGASTSEENYDFTVGNQGFIEQRDGDAIILTSYVNGVMFDRVSFQVGGEKLLYENFNEPQSIYIYLRDRILELLSPTITPFSTGYSPCTGDIGSVKYQTLSGDNVVFRTLTFYSLMSYSHIITKTFYAYAGDSVSVVAGLLASSLVDASPKLISALLSVILADSTGRISENFSFTLKGTYYRYNVTAYTTDGTERNRVEEGTVYYGVIIKDGIGADTYRTVYTGNYPEFIKRCDIGVAAYFFNDFYDDLFNVEEFLPAN